MNTGTYSLKNVKQCNGREGIAWSGTLYDGARKIADVQDDGNGGCLRIWFFDRAGGAPDEVKLEAHAKAQPPVIAYGSTLTMDVDLFLGQLFDYTGVLKRARAALRKQVVIVTPEGKFTHLKAAPSALTNPVARVLIAQRWPGASILNNDTNAADRLAAEYWREAMVAQQQETARHA